MLIELSKLENLPVGSFAESMLVGKLASVIVSPQDAKVIALKVYLGKFFAKAKIVSFGDVVDIDINGVTINSSDNLLPVDEIVRVKNIMAKKFNILGLPARTKNKKYLGRVRDAVIETTSGDIIRIYVGNVLSQKIFTRSMIHQIKNNEIILTFDDKAREKSATKVASLAEKYTEVA